MNCYHYAEWNADQACESLWYECTMCATSSSHLPHHPPHLFCSQSGPNMSILTGGVGWNLQVLVQAWVWFCGLQSTWAGERLDTGRNWVTHITVSATCCQVHTILLVANLIFLLKIYIIIIFSRHSLPPPPICDQLDTSLVTSMSNSRLSVAFWELWWDVRKGEVVEGWPYQNSPSEKMSIEQVCSWVGMDGEAKSWSRKKLHLPTGQTQTSSDQPVPTNVCAHENLDPENPCSCNDLPETNAGHLGQSMFVHVRPYSQYSVLHRIDSRGDEWE